MQVEVGPHGRFAVWTLIRDGQLFQEPLPQLRACVERLDDQPLVWKPAADFRPSHRLTSCLPFCGGAVLESSSRAARTHLQALSFDRGPILLPKPLSVTNSRRLAADRSAACCDPSWATTGVWRVWLRSLSSIEPGASSDFQQPGPCRSSRSRRCWRWCWPAEDPRSRTPAAPGARRAAPREAASAPPLRRVVAARARTRALRRRTADGCLGRDGTIAPSKEGSPQWYCQPSKTRF